jgi:hypothetical protein
MSTRSLLVLALIALGLAVYLHFFGFKSSGTTDLQSQRQKVARFEVEAVRRIELTNPDGTFVLQRKDDGQWNLEKPIAYPAEANSVQGLLSELQYAGRKATLDRSSLEPVNDTLKKFGLNPPRYLLRVTTTGEVIELAVGNETARTGTFYAMVIQGKEAQEVIVIGKDLVEQIGHNLDAWRNRKVFDFASNTVTGLILKKDQQEVEVTREGDAWKVLKPLETPAGTQEVNGYLGGLLGLQAQTFVSETGADLTQAGLTSPQFTLEVKLGAAPSQTLRIGQPLQNDPKHYYAQFGDRPAVFTLQAEVVDEIAQLLDNVRDRRIVDLGGDGGVQEVVITSGAQRIELRRDEKSRTGWVLPLSNGRAADADMVERFLMGLGELRAVEFLGSLGTPNPAYGLQKPQMTVQLKVSRGKDKVSDEVIKIGAVKGDNFYVESSFVPFIITVPKKFLESVPKQAADWFSLPLGLVKEGDILGLEWIMSGGTLSITRQKDGSWKADREGIEVDADYLNRQFKLITNLTAFRWTGPVNKKDFVKPVLTLRITTATEGVRELVFSSVEANQTRMTRITGDDFAFALPEESYQKLQLQPIKAAAPAP